MLQNIKEFALKDLFEKAVLVSGDHIFVQCVDYLRSLNKRIEVWSFRGSVSRFLIKKVGLENVFYLEDYIPKGDLIYKKL